MLIAVATDDGKHISQHFGRCAFFSIWQVKEGESPTLIGLRHNSFTPHGSRNPSPPTDALIAPPAGKVPDEPVMPFEPDGPMIQGEGHQGQRPGHGMHSHANALEGLADVQVIIAAGMGRRAVLAFQANNKGIFITQETGVEEAVVKCIEGSLDSGESCGDH